MPDFEVIRWTLTNIVTFGSVDARSTYLRWCLCMVLWQVKVKVKLALSTPWRHIMGLEVQLLAFFTCVLDGSEWSLSCPGRFKPGAHWVWGWVDFRACLDVLEKWQLSYPSQQSNHGSSLKQNCYKLMQDLLSYLFHTALALGIFLNSYSFDTHVYVSHDELLCFAVKCILARSYCTFPDVSILCQ
jgi:hypothetical protein